MCLSEPQVNTTVENIGARRLHTLMERILEDVSYSAGDAEVTNPNPHGFIPSQLLTAKP